MTSMESIAAQSTAPHEASRRTQALQVAHQFEAIFAQQMVTKLRENASATGNDLFGDGPGSDTFGQWFDTLLGDRIGSNLGLSDALMRDWEKRGEIAKAHVPEDAHAAQ